MNSAQPVGRALTSSDILAPTASSDTSSAIIAELRHRQSDGPAGKVVGAESYEWCPFHADGRGKAPHSPSLRINREKQSWFCDPCNIGGALSELAARLGVNGYQGISN